MAIPPHLLKEMEDRATDPEIKEELKETREFTEELLAERSRQNDEHIAERARQTDEYQDMDVDT